MAKSKITDQTKGFYIEQIKTTKKIIKEFSPTMLLNSLLSLVLLPYEKAKAKNGEKIFSGEINNLFKLFGIQPIVFNQ